MRVLNAAQMREADRVTIEELGVPSVVLMENAGRQVVDAIELSRPGTLEGHVAVLCGSGNNGGDGFVIARTLAERGVDVTAYLVGRVDTVRGDARTNLEIARRMAIPIVEVAEDGAWTVSSLAIAQSTLVVDALFGTGLRAPLAGVPAQVVADLNTMTVPVVAVDLPSGMSADTSQLIGECVTATMTVTFGAPKLPLVLSPADAKAGDVVVAHIGIPADVIDGVAGPRVFLSRAEDIRTVVPVRAVYSHKGAFGRVTVVGGAPGKTGAAYLAAMGALRAGAGLVTVATPSPSLPILASMAPEFMTEPLEVVAGAVLAPGALDQVLALRQDVVACGPGLGVTSATASFVRGLLTRCAHPLVLDADALTVLADERGALRGREGRPVIITPHPGEMGRLIGRSIGDVQASRLEVAAEFAAAHAVYVVLKGHQTVVAAPDGECFVNSTGGPGLATGGTGDILTGVIAGWLAQGLTPLDACRLGVFLHGLAGDLAEQREGTVAMVATSVLGHLGEALAQLTTDGAEGV